MTLLRQIRVIELGTAITAPLAGMLLGDLGADVVKVERPGGDPFRAFRGGKYSPHFAAYNRNKRSVVLDLNEPEGHAALMSLLETADVLLDNYRPGVLERLDLAPAQFLEHNPRLIHCSITGFGEIGPYAHRPAFDTVGQAYSGILGLFLDPREPHIAGPTISDNVTGIYAAYGVVSALYERTHTHRGRRLEVNMLEASMAFIPDAFAMLTQLGINAGPLTRVAASQSYTVSCKDGKLLAVHLSSPEKFWHELVRVLDAQELASDPRFETRMDRARHYMELRGLLADHFSKRPRSEWLTRLEKADVPFATINTLSEALEDPQVEALGTIYSAHHPTEGEIVGIHCPVRVDGAHVTALGPPPTLGEHTDEVLAHLARMTT